VDGLDLVGFDPDDVGAGHDDGSFVEARLRAGRLAVIDAVRVAT
jgi:hypothetical protein